MFTVTNVKARLASVLKPVNRFNPALLVKAHSRELVLQELNDELAHKFLTRLSTEPRGRAAVCGRSVFTLSSSLIIH